MSVKTILESAAHRWQAEIAVRKMELRLGQFDGVPVLYLDRPHWHNRGSSKGEPGEIFFSIWPDGSGRLNYNIHALKLRNLSSYRLESRKFAERFRAEFDTEGWPNVTTNFGPQTLFQGWIESDDSALDAIFRRFLDIEPLIERLLAAGARDK